jgi:pyruvate/2-oxoglutarate dehydrogenase complex dihydrolipoamide acyltransferase (E2) component
MQPDPRHRLFRQAALERLAAPEALDTVMAVTGPRSWIALAAVGLLLAAALTWGIGGRLRVEVTADGACVRGRPIHIVAPAVGQIVELLVTEHATVTRGQPVARVQSASPSGGGTVVSDVPSPYDGRIAAVEARVGDHVEPGRALFNLELGDPLEAVIFVDARAARQVAVAAPALVLPGIYDRAEYGYINGAVTAVGAIPASRDAMRAALGDERLAERLAAGGPVVAVRVRLTPAANPSGVRWSSSSGPETAMPSGIPCTASVIVAERRPITLVVPALQRAFGS